MEKYEYLKNMKYTIRSTDMEIKQLSMFLRTVEGRIPSIQMFGQGRATAHPAFEMKVFCISRHNSVPDKQAEPSPAKQEYIGLFNILLWP